MTAQFHYWSFTELPDDPTGVAGRDDDGIVIVMLHPGHAAYHFFVCLLVFWISDAELVSRASQIADEEPNCFAGSKLQTPRTEALGVPNVTLHGLTYAPLIARLAEGKDVGLRPRSVLCVVAQMVRLPFRRLQHVGRHVPHPAHSVPPLSECSLGRCDRQCDQRRDNDQASHVQSINLCVAHKSIGVLSWTVAPDAKSPHCTIWAQV